MSVSVYAVFWKELLDAIRAKTVVALSGVFVVFAGGLAAIQWVPPMFSDSPVDASTIALLNSMRQPTVVFVPMIGICLGYNVIAGERDRGSIRVMLGLPNTRGEVLVGNFVGRSAMLAVAILVGYGVVGLIAAVTYDIFDIVAFALFTLLTLGYGAVFVAIATGFSAGFRSRSVALGGAVLVYLWFVVGWDLLLVAFQAVTVGAELPAGGLPNWIVFVGLLNPATAFEVAVRAVIPAFGAVTTLPAGSVWYLRDWVGYPVLVGWMVACLGIGYWRFRHVDLG